MQRPDDFGIERASQRAVRIGDKGAVGLARSVGDGAGETPHVLAADRACAHCCCDRRPAGIGDDGIENLRQESQVVVDGAGSIDRIGDTAEFGQHRLDALPGRGMQIRQRHSGAVEHVGGARGAAAAARNDDHVVADILGRAAPWRTIRSSRRTRLRSRPGRFRSAAGTQRGSRNCWPARQYATGS